jgi:hypothetical protein
VDNFDEKYIDNILNSDTIFIKSKKKWFTQGLKIINIIKK